MWIVCYALGVLLGAILVVVMQSAWGLSWKQIGVYILLSMVSRIFFDASRDLRADKKAATGRTAERLTTVGKEIED